MKVTGIGGGHGLAVTLTAARRYADEVAAVVTVADDGGSSGRLTRELGIPPPGDIRNCLVALADESPLRDLYQHRFASGALTGHTVGNLVIAALAETTGDFVGAVDEAGKLIGTRGKVHPATAELVSLQAQVRGGVVKGQVAVAQTKAPIQAVYLEPAAPAANPAAVEAIVRADQVILGPGSLFTSLIATLLVPGVRDALRDTPARRIFVCNTRMQKGETEGFDVPAHVDALVAHLGADSIDDVVVQSPPLPTDGVPLEESSWGAAPARFIDAELATADGAHDPERLARLLGSLG